MASSPGNAEKVSPERVTVMLPEYVPARSQTAPLATFAACCTVRQGFANVPGFASLPLVATKKPAGIVTDGSVPFELVPTVWPTDRCEVAGMDLVWVTELLGTHWAAVPATPDPAFATGARTTAVARAGPARSAGPASSATASADRSPTDRLLWTDALWAPLGTNDTGRSSLPEPTSMRPRERWRTAARNRPGVTMRGRWEGSMPVNCVVSRQRFLAARGRRNRRIGLGSRSSGGVRECLARAPVRLPCGLACAYSPAATGAPIGSCCSASA